MGKNCGTISFKLIINFRRQTSLIHRHFKLVHRVSHFLYLELLFLIVSWCLRSRWHDPVSISVWEWGVCIFLPFGLRLDFCSGFFLLFRLMTSLVFASLGLLRLPHDVVDLEFEV